MDAENEAPQVSFTASREPSLAQDTRWRKLWDEIFQRIEERAQSQMEGSPDVNN
jgi:hypothetical protein